MRPSSVSGLARGESAERPAVERQRLEADARGIGWRRTRCEEARRAAVGETRARASCTSTGRRRGGRRRPCGRRACGSARPVDVVERRARSSPSAPAAPARADVEACERESCDRRRSRPCRRGSAALVLDRPSTWIGSGSENGPAGRGRAGAASRSRANRNESLTRTVPVLSAWIFTPASLWANGSGAHRPRSGTRAAAASRSRPRPQRSPRRGPRAECRGSSSPAGRRPGRCRPSCSS